MTLVAGSYERFIWGYKLKPTTTTNQTLTLTPLFSYAAHLSAVKSIAVSTTVAATTSSDDTIKLYDLSTSSELGSILLHDTNSLTSLSFFTPPSLSFPRNLIAGGINGSISIFDVDPFVLLETVQVHKKEVNDLSVHYSGKLGLSVGRDCCLGMVNLVRGKKSFVCRLDSEASIVEYCVGGEKFFMCFNDRVSVHDSEDAKIVTEYLTKKRVLCASPGENGLIVTGGEDRGITAWDTLSGKVAYNIADAHKSRVKGIVVLSRGQNSAADEDPFLVASASSDGVIRVWDIRKTSKEKAEPLSEVNTKSRITCLAGSSIKALKLSKTIKDGSSEEVIAIEDS